MTDGKYGMENYTVNCIQSKLLDGWVHPGVRHSPEVQEAAHKWSRDLLTMITMLNNEQPK